MLGRPVAIQPRHEHVEENYIDVGSTLHQGNGLGPGAGTHHVAGFLQDRFKREKVCLVVIDGQDCGSAEILISGWLAHLVSISQIRSEYQMPHNGRWHGDTPKQ
jgi:hypothetical protein